MTVTAMSALSLAPPLVSVGIHRRASMLRPLVASRRFRLILLGEDQERFAKACAGEAPQTERMSGAGWSVHVGMPWLERAQASIDCSVHARIRAGSHDLILGKVEAAAHSASGAPLLYLDGAYHACSAQRATPAPRGSCA
jgi:flavin reductase